MVIETMQSIDSPKIGLGTKIKYGILKTYPDYINQFPNYAKALDIMEYLSNQEKLSRLDYDRYDKEIVYAIEHEPEMTIVLKPEIEPTFLAWNSDYYFDDYFVPHVSFKGKRKLVTTLEAIADASAFLKIYFSKKLHDYLYQKVDYYNLSFVDALKIKQTFPIIPLLNRIRDYFQIPVIEFEDDNSLEISRQVIRESVEKDPQSPEYEKYNKQINTFESKTGIKLSTDEKIEFITEKILETLVADDYEEIES